MKAPELGELLVFYGGRFDPPHLGHEKVVQELASESKGVKVIPSGFSPYKPAIASPVSRLEMAKCAFGSHQVDDREIDRTLRSSSLLPTYSIETLRELKRELFEIKFAFVMGSDQFESFTQWKDYRELFPLCHWIILRRKGGPEPLKTLAEFEASGFVRKEGKDFHLIGGKTTLQIRETSAQACSSTEIRIEIAKTGSLPENRLSPAVESYLKEKKLYGIL